MLGFRLLRGLGLWDNLGLKLGYSGKGFRPTLASTDVLGNLHVKACKEVIDRTTDGISRVSK